MRFYRFESPNGTVAYATETPDGTLVELDGTPLGDFSVTDRVADVGRLLAPIAPPVIYGIGLNYRRHAAESNMAVPERPVVFFKAVSALQNPDAPIELPTRLASNEVDYEVELAVVIGKACKNVSREEALDYVLGYTVANDVSARDWQIRLGGGQWSRGKTFDTFCPLGPCIVTLDEFDDPNALPLHTRLNGETVQNSNTSDLIFDVASVVAFLSGSTTLLPGTVILTGTPEGVGMAASPPRWLRPGDVVECEIDGIGTLRNPVVAEG
ncbi:MAG: fumarylacetoacetate hydrolase family protein [Rhodothermales bacterium]|nr:fumarylacetoacetate hydrolase family protein [Rhodothermales bacterium]